MKSKFLCLFRKWFSLRSQPIFQFQEDSKTWKRLVGGACRFGGDRGPSKRKCQAQLHRATEEIRFCLKFCHWFTVLGCLRCTPHYNSQPTCHLLGSYHALGHRSDPDPETSPLPGGRQVPQSVTKYLLACFVLQSS